MKPRVLVLPLAALLIAGLVALRLAREEQRPTSPAAPPLPRRLAPKDFELYDMQNRLVKLERYLGRSRLVIVFFAPQPGADADSRLVRLRNHDTAVKRAGAEVVAITTARPAENEHAEARAGRKFPFPILTDINRNSPLPAAHQQWGLYDEASGKTREALFLVDRAGMVPVRNGFPAPVADPDAAIDALCRGEWPE